MYSKTSIFELLSSRFLCRNLTKGLSDFCNDVESYIFLISHVRIIGSDLNFIHKSNNLGNRHGPFATKDVIFEPSIVTLVFVDVEFRL